MNNLLSLKMFLVLALVCSITGCSMMGGEDDDSSVSNTPVDVDTITMRNGDVLTGTLDFDKITVKTSYLPEMSISKNDIDSIEFVGDSKLVKFRTKGGDVIRGEIAVSTFALTDSTLPEQPVVEKQDIRIIHCR